VFQVTSFIGQAAFDVKKREPSMNHSIYGADRLTHLKIVVVGLLFATVVAAVGMFAHVSDLDLGTAQLVKAGQPTVVSGATTHVIR
jgi:hypothetical protein